MRQLFSIFTIIIFMTACDHSGTQTQTEKKDKNDQIVRYGMVTGIKPEKIEQYRELHAKPWPQVISTLRQCNVQNYSIYLHEINGQHYLFSYFEYTGNNFDSDMKKMAADTVTQRWWKETDPCQLPLPEALAKHSIWTEMQQVFLMQ